MLHRMTLLAAIGERGGEVGGEDTDVEFDVVTA